MRHIPYKSNLSKWNKNIVSHTYTAHSTQSSTYTLAITLIPPSTKHTSKYQIERNKVVARDKCLRANDLSLLFFEFFFHFFPPPIALVDVASLPTHSISYHSLSSSAPMPWKTFSIFIRCISVACELCCVCFAFHLFAP